MEVQVAKRVMLSPEERRIESVVDGYMPVQAQTRRRIETILEAERKTRNINIRITESDLSRLKQRAADEGIPSQTLVSSILHRYLADRLVDEKQVLKSLGLLSGVAALPASRSRKALSSRAAARSK
jgi:predicted DNA binding CopG/RHH family protein